MKIKKKNFERFRNLSCLSKYFKPFRNLSERSRKISKSFFPFEIFFLSEIFRKKLGFVQNNAQEKRQQNEEVMKDYVEKVEGKTVGILNKKNLFDKGSKIKLSKDSHEIVEADGYNIKLDNGKSLPPKDLVILK